MSLATLSEGSHTENAGSSINLFLRNGPKRLLSRRMMASLVLEDGTIFKGKCFGTTKTVPGEIGKIISIVIQNLSNPTSQHVVSLGKFQDRSIGFPCSVCSVCISVGRNIEL